MHQNQQNNQILDKCENNGNKTGKCSFFDNDIMDVFLFIAAILPMIATAAIVHTMCKHAKLKALLTGIAFQPIRGTDAIFGSINENESCTCKAQWYTIAALALMIIGLILLILATTRKCRIFKGQFSLTQ